MERIRDWLPRGFPLGGHRADTRTLGLHSCSHGLAQIIVQLLQSSPVTSNRSTTSVPERIMGAHPGGNAMSGLRARSLESRYVRKVEKAKKGKKGRKKPGPASAPFQGGLPSLGKRR